MTHPLRGRDFRLLAAARVLSLTGDAAVPAAPGPPSPAPSC
ncbi:hypothetical protein BS35_004188 [Actinomadura glauciflava]|nr:hypothetical protein [Actinomadura glauciflava]MCR3741626.1 hypothetical protein [Actinomadura glauciflava]